MATASIRSQAQQMVLDGISWRTYVRLLRAFDGRRLHITYDRGILEIMTLSSEHERFKWLLGCLITVLAMELGLNIAGYGSMTCKRRRKQRGLEPDECYWVQNEPQVRCRDHIDLRRDPPPDLVIEVEVTRSVLDRVSIYAALGVPEVWRYDGEKLRVLLLGPDGKYTESDKSRAFPFLPLADVVRFMGLRSSVADTELLRQFRTWVQERIAAGWK